jgi:hypothetical protein
LKVALLEKTDEKAILTVVRLKKRGADKKMAEFDLPEAKIGHF